MIFRVFLFLVAQQEHIQFTFGVLVQFECGFAHYFALNFRDDLSILLLVAYENLLSDKFWVVLVLICIYFYFLEIVEHTQFAMSLLVFAALLQFQLQFALAIRVLVLLVVHYLKPLSFDNFLLLISLIVTC